MTRRKKLPPQHKTQQVTDSSGWTHVVKGPPGIIDPRSTKIRLEDGKSTESKYTLETYLDRFQKHYAPIWKESNCFKSLSRTFEQTILLLDNTTITQCICLGLGSMTAGSESSSYELAALTSMLEILGKNHDIQDVIFQDPIFNPLDRAVLQSLGYAVVETPDAFSRLGGTTFLFAPHLECLHLATALETATPSLSVGSDLDMYVEGLLSSLAESTKKGSIQIFRAFMGRTDSRPMPDFDRTSWCESTCIYWLKPREDDSGESLIEHGISSMNLIER